MKPIIIVTGILLLAVFSSCGTRGSATRTGADTVEMVTVQKAEVMVVGDSTGSGNRP